MEHEFVSRCENIMNNKFERIYSSSSSNREIIDKLEDTFNRISLNLYFNPIAKMIFLSMISSKIEYFKSL